MAALKAPDCLIEMGLSHACHIQKTGYPEKDNPSFGTPEGTRTPNPRNRNPMLYPLSHWRISRLRMYYSRLSPVCKGAV